jgi:hypothetical protein
LDVKTLKFGEMYPLGNPDTARPVPGRESALGLAVERTEPAALSDRGKQIGQILGSLSRFSTMRQN